jgi:phasin family protein
MAKTKKPTNAVTTTKQGNGEATAALFAGYDQLADLGRENFAAVLRVNAALSEGLEAIGKEVILYARRSFEQAAETATALLGAKTLEDVFQLNSEFAKANLERLIERSAKLSEMSVKVANEALAPLGGRVEATIHNLSRPHAG